jgi:hypothetical protein
MRAWDSTRRFRRSLFAALRGALVVQRSAVEVDRFGTSSFCWPVDRARRQLRSRSNITAGLV